MAEDSIEEEDMMNNVLIEDCTNNAIAEQTESCLPVDLQEVPLGQSGPRPTKRGMDLNEEEEEAEWTVVGRYGKRNCPSQKVDVYISCSEKLPRQFALAKLFETHNIHNICRVKFVNPHKVFVQFDDAESAEQLIQCKPLRDMGWRCQKPLEVAISYGVIKDVELDLSEKNMMDVITSTYELAEVKRLRRRTEDGLGWEECESVRLGFVGSLLPSWVFIYGVKINVESYVFPVTQCSRCWRFGHSLRMCPTKRIVCPKCGKGHANCETTTPKCINCTGSHMSLDRSCPRFRKEKRLRDIMAEFNCSYRKALQMYVPPDPPMMPEEQPHSSQSAPSREVPQYVPTSAPTQTSSSNIHSYANVTSTPIRKNNVKRSFDATTSSQPSEENRNRKKNRKNNSNQQNEFDWNIPSESESEANNYEETENESKLRKERREKCKSTMSFRLLISKMITIVFSDAQDSIKSKIMQAAELFIEWVTPMVRQYLWDWPLQNIFGS